MMSSPDQEDELTMLARARAGLSPSPADALRVRASVAGALAPPEDLAAEGGRAAPGRDVGMSAGRPLRVLVASVTVAAVGAGAGGYWMGLRAGARAARLPSPPAAMNEGATPSGPAAAPPPGAASPGPVSPVATREGASPAESTRRRPGPPARSRRPEIGASPTESLEHEVRALRAIEHALRDDDPRLALALLQQLERDVPRGKLVEERRAMSVIARCSAGDVPFGVNLAGDFAGDYPESVYLGRVQHSCERGGGDK